MTSSGEGKNKSSQLFYFILNILKLVNVEKPGILSLMLVK